MRYLKRNWWIGNLLALSVALCSTAQARAGENSGAELAVGVENILNLPGRTTDVLKPLATVFVDFSTGGARAESAVNSLVDALCQGPDPTSLVAQILPTVGIRLGSGFQSDPKWQFGSYDERMKLIVYLWSRAKSSKDSASAQRFGRAALTLAAMNDFQFGWSPALLIMSDEKECLRILGLTDSQLDALRQLVDTRKKLDKSWYANYTAALDEMNRIIVQPADETSDKVDLILHYLDLALQSVPQEGMRWVIINRTWEFLNFEASQPRVDGAVAVRAQLEKWKNLYAERFTAEWLRQALTASEGYPAGRILTF